MKRIFIVLCLLLLNACSAFSTSDPRTLERQWFDQEIEMEIAGIVNKPPFNQQQSRINAVAVDGSVLLIGQAVNATLKQQLTNEVKSLAHVAKVHNQVQVRALAGYGELSHDGWITTKVKSQIIASKKLTDAHIRVFTEAKEVYLLGYVSQEQAHIATEIARNVKGVKKVVKVFEYTQPAVTAE